MTADPSHCMIRADAAARTKARVRAYALSAMAMSSSTHGV
jgi:hypothetical protein